MVSNIRPQIREEISSVIRSNKIGGSYMPRAGLISYLKGNIYEDTANSKTYLMSSIGYSNAEVKKAGSLDFTGTQRVEYNLTGHPMLNEEVHEISFDLYAVVAIDDSTTSEVPLQIGDTDDNAGILFGASSANFANEIINVSDGTNECAWSDASGELAIGKHSVSITWDGSQYQISVDGVAKTTTTSGTPAVLIFDRLQLGQNNADGAPCDDLRIYNIQLKNAAGDMIQFIPGTGPASGRSEVQGCCVQSDGTITSRGGLVAGTVTLPDFFKEHTDGYGFDPNVLGYSERTDTGATFPVSGIQPAVPSNNSKDIANATLQYPKVKLNPLVKGFTGTWDGADYLAVAGLSGSETVTDSDGTSTPSVSAGQIDFTAGWCSYVILSDGTHIIIQSGEYADQVTCYDISGNGNHGTITGTFSTPWFDTTFTGLSNLVQNGFNKSVGATTDFIPASSSSPLVDCNTGAALTALPNQLKTIEAGITTMPQSAALIDADINLQEGFALATSDVWIYDTGISAESGTISFSSVASYLGAETMLNATQHTGNSNIVRYEVFGYSAGAVRVVVRGGLSGPARYVGSNVTADGIYEEEITDGIGGGSSGYWNYLEFQAIGTTTLSVKNISNRRSYVPISWAFEPYGDQRDLRYPGDFLPQYGAELFDSPATGTGWTDNADGTYTCDGSQIADSELALTVALDASDFQLDLTIISVSAGAITFTTVGDVSKTDDISAVGGYTQEFTTDGTDDAVVAGNAAFVGTIRVALREITSTGSDINDQDFYGDMGLVLYEEPVTSAESTRVKRIIGA